MYQSRKVDSMDKIFVFDLDGTIAPYKKNVPQQIADYINNNLGHVIIVTGGTSKYAKRATYNILDKTVIGLADYCSSIDLAKAMQVPKFIFNNVKYFQSIRYSIARQLNISLSSSGLLALTGGRSTIDIESFKINKGTLVSRVWQARNKKIIFFYDCKWSFLIKHSNDYPLIQIAHKSIRTNWRRIKKDIANELA